MLVLVTEEYILLYKRVFVTEKHISTSRHTAVYGSVHCAVVFHELLRWPYRARRVTSVPCDMSSVYMAAYFIGQSLQVMMIDTSCGITCVAL